MSISSTGSSSYTLTSTELARKRARDRKSQRAMRDRTKYTIDELSAQVSYLSSLLSSQSAALETTILETSALKAENQRLKFQLEETRFVGSEMCLENFRFPVSDSMLSGLPMPRPVPQSQIPGPTLDPETGTFEIVSTTSVHETVPVNCASTCLSDGILQTYILARRQEQGLQGQVEQTEQPAWLPDINALLTPQASKSSADNQSVSTVVSDILLSYHEINTLPRKVAVLYIMYKLLNWLIYRTPSTYTQLPPWLRPVPLQTQIPHPSWVDRIPWPNARTYLITHPEITFDDFAMVYSSSFEVSWPYSPSHVIGSNPNGAGEGQGISLNPVYEQHLRQLRNWTVGEKFRRKFPELGDIIESDGLVEVWT